MRIAQIKIWTRGPNHLKTDWWGPAESIDSRHPYCGVLREKCRFLNLVPKDPWTQNLDLGVHITSKLIARGQAGPTGPVMQGFMIKMSESDFLHIFVILFSFI